MYACIHYMVVFYMYFYRLYIVISSTCLGSTEWQCKSPANNAQEIVRYQLVIPLINYFLHLIAGFLALSV